VEADPFNAPKAARSVEVTEIPEPAWATGPAADPTPDASAAADGAAATPSATSPSGATPTPPPPAPVPEQAPEPTPPVSSPPPVAPTEVAVAAPPAAEPPAPDSTASATATTLTKAQTAGVDPWTSVTTSGSVALPAPPSPPPPAPLTPEQRSRREELESRIAQDEEALKRLLSDTDLDAADFEQSPELREIAVRLPALQAELRALEDGRAAPEVAEEP
jgi:hypothetical protein